MKTALYDTHLSLGAKMVEFNGWEMPLHYSGIINEHICTRSRVGKFDVSHMGRFEVKGGDSAKCLQSIVTNDISQLSDNRALYSPICNDNGGIIDDLILYKKSENSFILVVNASNRLRDLRWISGHLTGSAKVYDVTLTTSLVALQGPNAKEIMAKLIVNSDFKEMKSFDFVDTQIFGIKCMVSRTGYTGEDGFEIMVSDSAPAAAVELWNILGESGKEYQIMPCGLGSRDTLRLEAGLLLHGNDMDESITPLEVPLKWTVKFEKGDFVGKQSLLSKKRERKLVGFEILESKRIARHNNNVFLQNDGYGYDGLDNKERIGMVTSGAFSPTLNKSIGFCSVPFNLKPITEIRIDIGNKLYKARTVESIRFYRRPQ